MEARLSLAELPGATAWELRLGTWWMDAPELDVSALAERIRADGMRLVTMSGIARADGETEVLYHIAMGGEEYAIRVCSHNQSMPSISLLLPAANWIEREIQDLYALAFEGHPDPAALVCPTQLKPGFFRLPGGSAWSRMKSGGNGKG
jgi:NADH-quinone oxidoreductase subunit C